MFLNTAERVSESSVIDNWLLKKSMLAYKYASEIIKGKVLEIGCGNAYYVEKMAGLVDEYVLLDKFKTKAVESVLKIKNVKFIQTVVPPLSQLPDNSFDYVLCFQVIEHIQKDLNLIEEIYRVLKPGGIFLVSTPNKKMSLSRNPWHVREYFVSELRDLIAKCPFSEIKCMGVFGNDKAMGYYEKNKISVKIFRKIIKNLKISFLINCILHCTMSLVGNSW